MEKLFLFSLLFDKHYKSRCTTDLAGGPSDLQQGKCFLHVCVFLKFKKDKMNRSEQSHPKIIRGVTVSCAVYEQHMLLVNNKKNTTY